MDLAVLWYIVVIFSMAAYTMLDGFDLGVGALHLLTKNDRDRRIFMNAIGPVWDGNEVWLVVFSGALFAGFPEVYATSLAAFYNLVMMLLCGLIFRAAAIEFRSKVEHVHWRRVWDTVFSLASILIAFGIGLVLGNLIQGMPINSNKDFIGSFRMFWNPYSILLGITSVSLFMMHGAIYLRMKTEGALHKQLRSWVNYTIALFFFCYVALTAATLIIQPHMIERIQNNFYLFLFPLFTLIAILNVPYQMSRGNDGWAFISSCASIALLVILFAIGTFPVLVRSSIDPQNNSLTVYNSASSPLTLTVLLIIVAIGVPLVIAYGFYVYRLFRGKVSLEKASY